jgi:8-oxo-dGTP pyrophosphatase MutT (NUDIX family)
VNIINSVISNKNGVGSGYLGYIMDLRRVVGSHPLIMAGACIIVLNDKGHILLQKRTDSLDWGTIGGSLELGESLEEAAARELYEEAGLVARQFKFITLLSGKDMYYKYPHAMRFIMSWPCMKL